MSGIYIHIPFCKQACHYCDFHFSTNLKLIDQMHHALCEELNLRNAYLDEDPIETIYFGGGTPSIFSDKQIASMLNLVFKNYRVKNNIEITLEANPDDLDIQKLEELKAAGINRLSIGVQTFDDDRLKYINRTHKAIEAVDCIKNAQNIGFSNITADLIYAIPPEDMGYWEKDLQKMIDLGLPHISLYGLTIEEKTVFGKWMSKGKFNETTEELAANQYRYAIEILASKGYNHYEVSNFAKPGFESKHNSAYWAGKKYLGIGPGAHSYNGTTRASNVSNNSIYIKSLNDGKIPQTIEELSDIQRVNEFILIRLRTSKGLIIKEFEQTFKRNLASDKSMEIHDLTKQGLIDHDGAAIALSTAGFMVADEIALRLFYDEQ